MLVLAIVGKIREREGWAQVHRLPAGGGGVGVGAEVPVRQLLVEGGGHGAAGGLARHSGEQEVNIELKVLVKNFSLSPLRVV